MSSANTGRVDPWPLPRIPDARSVTKGARTRLLHDDGAVQIVAWECRRDCAELRAERTHSHHVISVLRRGACTIRQGGRSATLDASSIVVHRPGSTYETRHPYGLIDAGWSLAYDDATAGEILAAAGAGGPRSRPSHIVAIDRMRAVARPVIALFALESAHGTNRADPFEAQECALRLLAAAHAPGVFSWSPSDPARRSERALVDRACDSMRARFDEPLRLADVARDAGCSEFRLYRAFRRQRGTTPGRYLRRIRLTAVLDSLAGGARSLTEVALDAGFASHSHMTAMFRRQFGRTPRDVRRAIRGK